jgi:4,5-DOPA dioxygenase extradiol
VSLFANESPRAHYDLGRAVASLRGENIAIIGTGMAVHNLRDFRVAPAPLSYVYSFDAALKEAAEEKPAGREDAMANLLKRPDARRAHPTMEHLMPVFVAAGAADSEQGKQLWTMPQWSMSWAQYRFGEVTAGDGSRI